MLRDVKTFGFDQFPSLVKTGFWKAGLDMSGSCPRKFHSVLFSRPPDTTSTTEGA